MFYACICSWRIIGQFRFPTTTNFLQVLNTLVHQQNIKLQLLTQMRRSTRERTISMFMMLTTDDPFERDDWFLEYIHHGANFRNARIQLSETERNGTE